MKKMKQLLLLLAIGNWQWISAQPVPSTDEKIPYLCTFSKDSQKEWGDDDFVQIFFFVIPETQKKPIYIRIYDPENGGKLDESHASFNSKTRFTIYGGKGAHSDPAAKKVDPVGNFKSGMQLSTKTFAEDKTYDQQWYTFGPFNPVEGELQPEIGGYVFKIVIEGLDGDDGNLYKMYLSTESTENKPVEGGNSFAYEYTMRLSEVKNSIAHLYPFVAKNVVAIKINVFDFDDDGIMRVVSVDKKGEVSKSSSNGVWAEETHKITKEEINTSLDVQFIKQSESKNNNIVVYITNQYGELMPFFTAPIGGVPKYRFKIGVKVED